MKTPTSLALAMFVTFFAAGASAQGSPSRHVSSGLLDVGQPFERVSGAPGRMTVQSRACRDLPSSAVRRRVVDLAAQEWSFFGFPVLDRLNDRLLMPPGAARGPDPLRYVPMTSDRPPLLNSRESARVAASIAGYWAVAPGGQGILADQNRAWDGPDGIGARWVAPWSAAFISWVMCEAGLGTTDRFRRAVAHHVYIDQAIRARDGHAPEAAFVAYEIGERSVQPGDLLCASSRPRYRSIAERRRQLGEGARSHCDVVVEVDEAGKRILVIGGNVLRSVTLKVFPAGRDERGVLRPLAGTGLFAHLQLRADPIEANALVLSPTVRMATCASGGPLSPRTTLVFSSLALGTAAGRRC